MHFILKRVQLDLILSKKIQIILICLFIIHCSEEIFSQSSEAYNEKPATLEAKSKEETEIAKNKEQHSNNQEKTLKIPKSLAFGGFVDFYYLHNNNLPSSTERSYTTQALRNQEFNINLAYVDVKVEEEKYRGRLAIQYGTSVNKNYSSEPIKDSGSNQFSVRNLQEAYIGIRLTQNTWVDAGIYLGHIGFESWISHLNWNYTRAFALDYVPYYTSGVKLTHNFTDKFIFQFHIMNGWQTITDNNKDKDLGLQWKYIFSPKLTITWNQQAGNQAPNNERKQTRFYSNAILEWHWTDWISLASSFDVGTQKISKKMEYEPWLKDWNPQFDIYRNTEGKAYKEWYHGTAWVSFHWDPRYRISFRVERFYDPKQVVAESGTKNGFITNGYTATLDLLSWQPALLRIEYNYRRSIDSVFDYETKSLSKKEDFLVLAFSMKF
jgi:hypothetical protein